MNRRKQSSNLDHIWSWPRRARGQALVEGACIIPVMILLVVFLAMFLINTSIVGTYNFRVNAIASEAARQYMAGKWWLGMERDAFNESGAEDDMKDLVDAEIEHLGMGNAHASNFKFTRHHSVVAGEDSTIMHVEFDVTELKCISYGLFPSKVTLHATGMASDVEFAQSKHGMCLIHAVDPLNPSKQRAFRIPILNASKGENRPADSNTTDPWLTAGPTLGTPPIVTMNIFVKNQGQLMLQQTDANGNSVVSSPRDWDPLK